ncbi:uncharacterized protein [Oryza sativa Japonica Group]|uniref:uncharacterized protein n=1 Tax=Oryza sativa subsp. japonica TaxID=39947 RepID=UPI00339C0402
MKQAAQLMAQEGKLDLLLRTMEENEKKREEVDGRTRTDFADLKKSLEVRLPAVEKKVEILSSDLATLNHKVQQLESSIQRQPSGDEFAGKVTTAVLPKEELNYHSTPFIKGQRDPEFASPDQQNQDGLTFQSGNSGLGGGIAAFWLQSVRSQLAGATWFELCDRVCGRFARDRKQALIRQWIHITQTSSVADYVDRFDSIMHQLMAYGGSNDPAYFVTKFVDGLKDHIRVVVMVQRPQDLDSACTVALLQEEALEGVQSVSNKKNETTTFLKTKPSHNLTSPTFQARSIPFTNIEDKRGVEFSKGRDDKVSALRSYRRSKGLCFVCGEKWGRDHKCATTVQLHVVEELINALKTDPEENCNSEGAPESEEDSLMAISFQALNGTDSSKSIRLRGWVQNTELLMLVDSGSTHSFIDAKLGAQLCGLQKLNQAIKVQVADGSQLFCDSFLPNCSWWSQGHSFTSDFRLLPLGSYDAILGMDWLEQFSPMQVDWVHKWIAFQHHGQAVQLQGIHPQLSTCFPISNDQLQGMSKKGAVMCLVHLNVAETLTATTVPEIVQPILNEFQEIFSEPTELPPKRNCDHHIPLVEGAKPVNLRPYRYKPALKDEIERQVAEMLRSGVIQPSSSPFSSPALLVKKKDGTWRLCIDYRQLNDVTVKSKYPVPVIDELLDELAGSKWFSKLDLRAGYHQIRMAEGDEYKTAFQTHSGHYEYKVMSFGLTGAPATFLSAMNETLSPVLRKFALVFFDDILIYSPTLELHLQHVRTVLQLLSAHQWKVKLSKCSFAQQEISYLGHVIGAAGVATDPAKIQDVVSWPQPTTIKKLRGFLGLAGYYRKFVRHFGLISKPLTQLLKKGIPFKWTPEIESAFQQLKQALVAAPVLALPDFSKHFTIETDASDVGIGAVLSQEKHPIAYLSRALGPKTRGLSTYEKEYMAIILAVEHWRPYLQQGEFIILTDHHSLMHLTEQRLHTPWQQKAFTKLLGLQYKICYRKGVSNAAADALSRRESPISEVAAISECIPSWMQELMQGYQLDGQSKQLLAELAISPNSRKDYQLCQGILKYKGKIWVSQ